MKDRKSMGTLKEAIKAYPGRVLFDVAGMFSLATLGASAFYFIKGAKDVRMKALGVGQDCAVWGGLVTTFECALEYARKKDDPLNGILSASAATGLLELMRGGGLSVSARSAVFSGGIVALLEGANIVVTKAMSDQKKEPSMSYVFGQPVPESSFASVAGLESRFKGLSEKFRFCRAETA